MRTFMIVGAAGSLAAAWALLGAAPASAQYQNQPPYPPSTQFQYPLPPRTITFDQAMPLAAATPVNLESGLFKAPVRVLPTGSTVGYFRRIEVHDGRPMGIVTLKDAERTVAIPLERLRFNPAGRDVLTDLNWFQINTIPSGIRYKDSPGYPFGLPRVG